MSHDHLFQSKAETKAHSTSLLQTTFLILLLSGCIPHPSTFYVPKETAPTDHVQGETISITRSDINMSAHMFHLNDTYMFQLSFGDKNKLPKDFDESKIILINKNSGEQYKPLKIEHPGYLGFTFFGLLPPPKQDYKGIVIQVYFPREIGKAQNIKLSLPLQEFDITEIEFNKVTKIRVQQPF